VWLDILVPRVDADRCFVAVHRFPTQMNPTERGLPEPLYFGLTSPGVVVSVKKYVQAIPVKLRYDDTSRSYFIEYYEPQEFGVVVHCTKGRITTAKFSKIVEVYPRSIVHREAVSLARPPSSTTEAQAGHDGGGSASGVCYIAEVREGPGGYVWTDCATWIRGPYLYSIEGLETVFCLAVSPRASAVYVESFADSAFCYLGSCDQETPQWLSAGRMLTPSVVGGCSEALSGNSKVRVYLNVLFRYVEGRWCDTSGDICYRYWYLYPVSVGGQSIDWEPAQPYTPPTTSPHYASGPFRGNCDISFMEIQTYRRDLSSASITSTDITFTYIGAWSTTLTVNFYKSGRDDSQYTKPYVRVIDVSGRPYGWYYWWYRDDDPANYEIMFCSR